MLKEEHPLHKVLRIEKGKLNPQTNEEWFEFTKHMMTIICVLDWLSLSQALQEAGCPIPHETVVGFVRVNTPFKAENCAKKGCHHIYDFIKEKEERRRQIDVKIFDN